MFASTIVGAFCALACAFPLHINRNCYQCAIYHNNTQIGIYVDDTDPNQCTDVARDRAMGWPIILSGRFVKPGYASPYCPQATLNLVEW